MKSLVLATSNKHKLDEIRAMLAGMCEVKGLKDIGFEGDIPETGTTIKENSAIKARALRAHLKDTNVLVIADDSGLEVKALNNAPGVYSARYAGEQGNDRKNNEKLLTEMKAVTSRAARFVTVLTLINERGEEQVFEGEVKGTIAYEARGEQGFGYDPLFIPTGYRSTFAELGAEVKNSISHRKMAVKQLVDYLENKGL